MPTFSGKIVRPETGAEAKVTGTYDVRANPTGLVSWSGKLTAHGTTIKTGIAKLILDDGREAQIIILLGGTTVNFKGDGPPP